MFSHPNSLARAWGCIPSGLSLHYLPSATCLDSSGCWWLSRLRPQSEYSLALRYVVTCKARSIPGKKLDRHEQFGSPAPAFVGAPPLSKLLPRGLLAGPAKFGGIQSGRTLAGLA